MFNACMSLACLAVVAYIALSIAVGFAVRLLIKS